MRIAILGWGSLLWEGGPEFDRWHKPWKNDGPTLKLEFSRISISRSRALTLVVDEKHGSPTRVAWCLSRRGAIDDAVCDLRCREGTTIKKIGRIVVAQATGPTDGDPEKSIVAWARSKKLDSVVWTALTSNFQKKTKKPFSVAAAISHLKGLDPVGKAKAAEYVWRAPEFVRTGLRAALQREPWFSERG
jgi:hypothetical protein